MESYSDTTSNILHDSEAYADAVYMQLALRPTCLSKTACVFRPNQLAEVSL